MKELANVRYKWSKLFAAKNYGGKECVMTPLEQQELLDDLDQAASAISDMVEKERDEFAEGFAEWLARNNYNPLAYGSKTIAQLLTIYKEQNHGK